MSKCLYGQRVGHKDKAQQVCSFVKNDPPKLNDMIIDML